MNTKNATEWLRLNQLADIVVGIDSDRQPPAFAYEVPSGEEGDIEEAISFFEQNVRLLQPGRYRITAKKNKTGGAGKKLFKFTIGEEEQPQATSQPSIGDINGLVQQQVQAQIAGYEKERTILDMKKEIELLQGALKEKNSWQTQLSFLGEQMAGHLVNKMGFKLPAPGEMEPTAIPRQQPQMPGDGQEITDTPEQSSDLDNRHEAAIGSLCEKVETEGAVNLVEKLSQLSPEALNRINELDPSILEKVAQIDDSVLGMINNM